MWTTHRTRARNIAGKEGRDVVDCGSCEPIAHRNDGLGWKRMPALAAWRLGCCSLRVVEDSIRLRGERLLQRSVQRRLRLSPIGADGAALRG